MGDSLRRGSFDAFWSGFGVTLLGYQTIGGAICLRGGLLILIGIGGGGLLVGGRL
jgi:hypothetical protein